MSAMSRSRQRPRVVKATSLWYERIVALIALCNLILVLFDMSYIRFRDFYLSLAPGPTQWYGETFKGIEAERSTVRYLETFEALEAQLAVEGENGLAESPDIQALLAELRRQSVAMVDENPFAIANKSGTLERIKNLMRDRVGVESSKAAFREFWSRDYLEGEGWPEEIEYFNTEIEPLMATNYFRAIGENRALQDGFWRRIDLWFVALFGENGAPRDDFWRLVDIWFVAFFGLELLARVFYISRRYKNYTWLDAVLLRWYDLFLLIPLWRWLRVIPVTVRLNQSQLVNMIPLRNRINRIFITNFAVELTEVVVLRTIDQIQNLIREGEVARWVLNTGTTGRYIDINGVDEVQAIASRLVSLMIYQVLPKVKPEIDALLQYNVSQAFDQAPGYQGFRQLPGIGDLPDQIAHQVVSSVSRNLYEALTGAVEDEKGGAIAQQLFDKIGTTVRAEIQQDQTLEDLQTWTVALLEEFKINYVKQLSVEDVERLMEENYRIYNITQER